MAKSSDNKSKKENQYLNFFKTHKLILSLSFLLAVALFFSFIYPKYKDWDNAQLIKGLARDFPILVEEIEQATDLELEIKSNCSTTTEKFSEGVKTCEVSIAHIGESVELYNRAFSVMKSSSSFIISDQYENGKGYNFKYQNKNSCSFRTESSIYSTCITAVRDANLDLAIEEFSKIRN